MTPFELAITVQPMDIDGQGHVNNVVYLRWMQEAAEAHWDAKATAELKTRVNWVVTRHEVDYKAPAFAGERLVARTWVGEPSRSEERRVGKGCRARQLRVDAYNNEKCSE